MLFVLLMALPAISVAGADDGEDPELSGGQVGPGVFIKNEGQWDPTVAFMTATDAGNIALCRDGIAHLLMVREERPNGPFAPHADNRVKDGCIVTLTFEGGSPDAVLGEDRVDTVYNFFLGNDPQNWRSNVPGYRSVIYRDVWEGIDIVYHYKGSSLKYDIIIAPGADPDDIRMKVEGADSVRISDGSLVMSTPIGTVITDSGLRTGYSSGGSISSSFRLDGSTYGFDLGRYDRTRAVVIDPTYNANAIEFSTYIGGSGWDYPQRMDSDSNGDIYITGSTDSYDFPVSRGAYQNYLKGWQNAFVFKMDSTGSTMIYSTYIGGSYADIGCDIKVDALGNVYLVGYTNSEDFPVTSGAYNDTLNRASDDLFLLRLDSAGSNLLESTYIGGSDGESGYGYPSLDVDSSNYLYISVDTYSTDFPLTADAYQDTFTSPGSWTIDIVFFKFDLSTMSLLYSTYLGGSGDDVPSNIVYDQGCIYVGGSTNSYDFNVTSGAYQVKNAGENDAFLFKFDMKANSLLYSTYIGGMSTDAISDLQVDNMGNTYACGATMSTNWPLSTGAFDSTYGGDLEGIVVGLDPLGGKLTFSSFVGNDGEEVLTGIALDDVLDMHVCGYEMDWYEDGLQFKTLPGVLQEAPGGGWEDGLYVKVSSDGGSLLYSTFLGGSDYDECFDVMVDIDEGEPIVMGSTDSGDFPISSGAYQTSNAGGSDAFVIKFDLTRSPGSPLNPAAVAGDGFVDLTWSAPMDDGGAPILGYIVYRGTQSGLLDLNLGEVGMLEFNDTTVTNGKTYYYGIRARNLVGEGVMSEEVVVRPAGVPSPPRNLKVASVGDKVVDLSWTPPEYSGGIGIFVTRYDLYRAADGGVEGLITIDGPLTKYKDEDVQNGVNYSYRLVARNEFGPSPSTDMVYAIPMTLPTIVLDLTGVSGSGFVHIFWTAPSDDGGSPILNYSISRRGTSTKQFTVGPVLEYNDTQVVNGEVYTYTVRGKNLAGFGPASSDFSAKPLGRPSAPRAVTIEVSPASVLLSWEPPAVDGGAPIEEYRIYRGQGDEVDMFTVDGTDLSYTDGSLTNGMTYVYWITARNQAGESVPSIAVNGTPLDVPGAPTDLAASAGDGFVVLTWGAPLNDGGTPILGYILLRGEFESVMEPIATLLSQLSAHNDTTVENGRSYLYQLKAFNSFGNGTLTTPASARPAGLPSPPDRIAVTAGDGSVDIAWSKPLDDGGLAVTAVRIYKWEQGSAEEMVLETTSSGGTYKDNDVVNGATYYYALTSTNELGEGPRSQVHNATPLGKPTVVRDLIVRALSSSSAEVSWSAPDSDGGSPILKYNIYRSMGAGAWIKVAEVEGDLTKYVDGDCDAGKMYRYKVSAVNAQGEGPQTDERAVQIKEEAGGLTGIVVFLIVLVVLIVLIAIAVTAFILSRKGKEEARPAQTGMMVQQAEQMQMPPYPVNAGIMPPAPQQTLPPTGYYQPAETVQQPGPIPPPDASMEQPQPPAQAPAPEPLPSLADLQIEPAPPEPGTEAQPPPVPEQSGPPTQTPPDQT